jgi:hypothetical protein
MRIYEVEQSCLGEIGRNKEAEDRELADMSLDE